jgi:hypothetical protein
VDIVMYTYKRITIAWPVYVHMIINKWILSCTHINVYYNSLTCRGTHDINKWKLSWAYLRLISSKIWKYMYSLASTADFSSSFNTPADSNMNLGHIRPNAPIFNSGINNDRKVFNNTTSVDTEMCYPKGKCGCQNFILLTLKKKKIVDTGVLDFLIKN